LNPFRFFIMIQHYHTWFCGFRQAPQAAAIPGGAHSRFMQPPAANPLYFQKHVADVADQSITL